MFSKRSSIKDQSHLWRLVRGSRKSGLHHKMPRVKSSNSADSDITSLRCDPSFSESFDLDSSVFEDSENKSGDDYTRPLRMHEKLREQWSDGPSGRPMSQNLFRKKKALSASCPVLDASAEICVAPSSIDDSKLHITRENDGMLHKSMLNLSSADSMAPVSSSSFVGFETGHDGASLSDALCAKSPLPEISVQICINDVSVDNPEDFQTASGDEDDLNMELIRRQKRRSSWCPEKERKKDEKEEKQRMLGINGRSQSLSSLEGQDDSDESDDDSEGVLPVPQHPSTKPHGRTPGTSSINGDFTSGTECANGGSSNDRFQKRLSDPSQLQKQIAECSYLRDGRIDDAVDQSNEAGHNSFNDGINFSEVGGFREERKTNMRNDKLDQIIAASDSNRLISQVEEYCAEDAGYTSNRKVQRVGSHSEIAFPKEEKTRRRSSVFSKISNYRQNRKAVKGPKLNHNDHQFVSVSVSNSTSCDVCGKFLSNKPALQCENCAINVHELSCIDQTLSCARNNRLLNKEDSLLQQKDFNRNDEENNGDVVDSFVRFGLGSTQVCSHSTESLDDAFVSVGELDEETEMLLMEDMAEAWSVTVDKRTLKKMAAKDIKRQDHIWELIQTERNHFRTLKKMQKIFAFGMMKEMGLSKDFVEQIFPRLDDLLEIHSNLLKKFFERQQRHVDRSIEHIGDLLVELLQGQTGDQMKSVYGEFCSRHSEAVNTYKELKKNDRKFQAFIDKCSRLNICQRQGVDECILLVTQRLTKYPLLIEAIIKTTIDAEEKENLNRSLLLAKEIITSVNRQVDAFFKHQRFVDILNRLDQKSSTIYRGTKFKKFELLVSERKLQYEGYLKWMSARGKSTEVLAVVLSDIMFFLMENNQKYYFFSQDGKSSVVSLSKLLVREKDGLRDSRGFYLICSSDDPEMYELICKSPEERSHWIAQLKDAIIKCSQEESGRHALSAQDQIQLNKSSSSKFQQLLDLVQEKDSTISNACKEKTEIILEFLNLIGKNNERSLNHKIENNKPFDSSCLINAVLQLETRLIVAVKQINALSGQQEADSSSLSNGVLVNSLPKKRAETFSGFEYRNKEPAEKLIERRRNASGYEDHHGRPNQNESLTCGEPQPDFKNCRRRGSLIITPNQTEPCRNNNNGDKSNRRMSVNLIPSMLNKLHRDKESFRTTTAATTTTTTTTGCNMLKSDEWFTSTVPPTPPLFAGWLSTLVTDQCESLAQIAVHIYSLLDLISNQSNEMQNLRLELSGINQNVSKLYEENDRLLADRRLSGFHHDKQLEELRNFQSSIEKQKKELLKLREIQETELQMERRELEKRQLDIDKQRAELKLQKDHLKQEKDFLQRQYDLFEEQRVSVLKSKQNLIESSHDQSHFAVGRFNFNENLDKVSEISKRGDSSSLVISPNNLKEPRLSAGGRRNLVSKESGAGNKPPWMPTPVQQILPMKLSTGGSSSSKSHLSHQCSKPEKLPNSGMSKNFSESFIAEGAVSSQSSSLPLFSNLYISRSQPQINFSISAIPSHMQTNSMLPIHLAEKSKSTPSSAHNSPTRYSGPCADFPHSPGSSEKKVLKPPALKESDIIYF